MFYSNDMIPNYLTDYFYSNNNFLVLPMHWKIGLEKNNDFSKVHNVHLYIEIYYDKLENFFKTFHSY